MFCTAIIHKHWFGIITLASYTLTILATKAWKLIRDYHSWPEKRAWIWNTPAVPNKDAVKMMWRQLTQHVIRCQLHTCVLELVNLIVSVWRDWQWTLTWHCDFLFVLVLFTGEKVCLTCYVTNEISVELIHHWHKFLHFFYSVILYADVAWSPLSYSRGYFGILDDECNLPHHMKQGFFW